MDLGLELTETGYPIHRQADESGGTYVYILLFSSFDLSKTRF